MSIEDFTNTAANMVAANDAAGRAHPIGPVGALAGILWALLIGSVAGYALQSATGNEAAPVPSAPWSAYQVAGTTQA